MKIKCKGCGYIWKYKGESEYYVSCPRCRRNIKVLKATGELNPVDKTGIASKKKKGGKA